MKKDLASFVPGRLRHSGRSNCSDRLRRQQLQHCFFCSSRQLRGCFR